MTCHRLAVLTAGFVLSGSAFAQDAAPAKPADKGLAFVAHRDPFGNVVWRVQGNQPTAPAVAVEARAEKTVATPPAAGAALTITFEVYQDDFRQYRWRMKGPTGQTVAASVDGYRTREEADRMIETIKTGTKVAKVVKVDDKAK